MNCGQLSAEAFLVYMSSMSMILVSIDFSHEYNRIVVNGKLCGNLVLLEIRATARRDGHAQKGQKMFARQKHLSLRKHRLGLTLC